jgi:hypothetical protein
MADNLDSLGARLQRALREADLPAPLKQYLAIKGLQGSVLGALGQGDPQAEAAKVLAGDESYNPLPALLSSVGAVGSLGAAPAGVGTLGAGFIRKAKVVEPTGAELTKVIREQLKPYGLYKKDITVDDVRRLAAPGVYQNPRAIVEQAKAQLGAEDPLLQRLWGVSRQDLYDIAKSRTGTMRPEDIPGMTLRERVTPEAVQAVMNPRNEQRILDTMELAQKVPGLRQTQGWYVMDPAYQRLAELIGPEEAVKQYNRLNITHGVFSAASAVPTELMRGSTAAMLAERGEFPAFMKYGGTPRTSGMPLEEISAGVPEWMRYIPGHMAHSTAHTQALKKYLDTGELSFTTGKVPPYIAQSGVPQTGFSTGYPVIDTHMGKQFGYMDTRTAPSGSMALRETDPLARWYSEKIAGPLGIEPGYAQPMGWTVYGPQTGVMSELGAPKLEIVSNLIGKRAAREGVSPEAVRDAWLLSKGAIGAGAGLVTLPSIGSLVQMTPGDLTQ